MNKKNEQELEKKFQDIFDNHFEEIPYYSDMDFRTEINMKELATKVKNKRPSPYRGLKIASLIFVVFLCSSAFAILISNGTVEAGKEKLLNLINSTRGEDHKITDEEYFVEINDLDDKKSIEKAKDILPNLVLLEEIDDGYVFNMMSITKISKNEVFSTAFYFNSNDDMLQLIQNKFTDDTNIGHENAYEKIEINDGILLLTKDIDGEIGINSATYVENNMLISINGKIDIVRMEKIMREIIIPKL